jgi:hypothetical protein
MVWGLNPFRGNRFFFSPKCSDWVWGQPSLLFSGYQGSVSGIKLPGHEIDNSSLSIAEVKNEWSCISTPPVCLHCMDREGYTFNFFFYGSTALYGPGPPRFVEVSWSHNWDTPQSVGLLWTRDQLVAKTSTWQHTTLTTDRHPCPRWDSNPRS